MPNNIDILQLTPAVLPEGLSQTAFIEISEGQEAYYLSDVLSPLKRGASGDPA